VIGTGKKAKVIEEYNVDTGLRHLRALEARDALEILAEPNIMAINGKQATFTYICRRGKYATNLCHRTAQCQ
jgi:Flp pilus assembly secretin CpaC